MPRPSRKQRTRRMLPPCVTRRAGRPSRAAGRSARRSPGPPRHARRQHPPRALLPGGARHRRLSRDEAEQRRRRRDRGRRPRRAHHGVSRRARLTAARRSPRRPRGPPRAPPRADACGILLPRAEPSLPPFSNLPMNPPDEEPFALAPEDVGERLLAGAEPAPRAGLKKRVIPDPPEIDQAKGRQTLAFLLVLALAAFVVMAAVGT